MRPDLERRLRRERQIKDLLRVVRELRSDSRRERILSDERLAMLRARRRGGVRLGDGERELMSATTGSSDLIPRPAVVEPDPDVVVKPGQSIEQVIRDARGAFVFTVGIDGVFSEAVHINKEYGAHWGGDDMRINLVGVSDDAEIRGLSWHSYGGNTVKSLGVYGVAVRNSQITRAPIWSEAYIEQLTLSRVPLYIRADPSGDYYEGAKWGIKISDGCGRFIASRCPRGQDPMHGVPTRYYEHWAYITSVLEAYVMDCDMSGANRTGFMARTPGLDGFLWPTGPYLIDGNIVRDHGKDWSVHNGGSAITVWESRGLLQITNNQVTNSRYGCCMIAQQPADQNPFTVDSAGHVHEHVVIENNTFDNSSGDRMGLSCSSVVDLRVANNSVTPPDGSSWDMIVDDKWSYDQGAPPCDIVDIDLKAGTWDGTKLVDYAPQG